MAKKYKKALVTGGAGFIGSHIVDALIKRHIKVFVVDDLSSGKKANLNPNAKFSKMSLTSVQFPAYVKKIKPDVIIHCAAQIDVRKSVEDPRLDAKVNILGTLNLIEGGRAAKTKKFIFLSTGGALYPAHGKPPFTEKTCVDPLSPYAITKCADESYFRFTYEAHGIPYTILRLANVYGPRQDSSKETGVIAIFTKKLMENSPVTIFGDGKQTRDYVYVNDVARAVLKAMDRSVVGTFNIGTGREISVNQLFKTIKKLTGADSVKRYGPANAGEVRRSALNSKLAQKKLGWTPKVRLEEGLKKTLNWHRKK